MHLKKEQLFTHDLVEKIKISIIKTESEIFSKPKNPKNNFNPNFPFLSINFELSINKLDSSVLIGSKIFFKLSSASFPFCKLPIISLELSPNILVNPSVA